MKFCSLFLLWMLASCSAGQAPVQGNEDSDTLPAGELLRRGDMLVSTRHPLPSPFHREEHYAIYSQGELCGMRFCTLDATGVGPEQILKIEETMAIFNKGSWQVSRAQWNLGHDWRPISLRLVMRTTQVLQPPSIRAFSMTRDATGYSLAMRRDGQDFNAHVRNPGDWFCSTPELVIPWLRAADKPFSIRTLMFETGDLAEVMVIPRSVEHRDGLSYHIIEMRSPGQAKGEILTVASQPPGSMMSRTLLAYRAQMKLVTPDVIRSLRQKLHLPDWPAFPL